MRVPGVPFTQGKWSSGTFRNGHPKACVLHRTYGTLNGDGFSGAMSIGINGRDTDGDGDKDPIGFHFLIGKYEGQWGQFFDTNTVTAHAKGANTWAIGIEFDGVNEGPLTDWQVRAGAWIIGCLKDEIIVTYYDGPRAQVQGYLPHNSVPGSNHTDRVTREDWNRIVAVINNETEEEDVAAETPTMMIAPTGEIFSVAGVWRHQLTCSPREALDSYNIHAYLGGKVSDLRENGAFWEHVKRTTRPTPK